MAFRSLQFTPGLNAQFTPTLNRAGWSASNLIRWPASNDGLPEVVGGWQYFLSPVVQLDGRPSGLHSWATLTATPVLAAGTNERLYVCEGGAPYDITPIVHTSNLSGPFDTMSGSPIVTVADGGYTPEVGQSFIVSGSTTVGGLTMNGEWVVATVGVGTFTFDAGTNAGSTVSGGGGASVVIDYLLAPDNADQGSGQGWGVGTWGSGTWGTPRPQTGSIVFPSIWELDNWGEELIGVRRGSTIFDWQPSTGLTTHATPITDAPPAANGTLVAMPEQQIIAWGASVPDPIGMTWGDQDPMLLAWCSYADYNDWFASSANSAGSFRLTQGSQIMTVQRSQGQMLVWTDTSIVSMQFLGGTLIYGFQQLGTGCGLVAPKAAAVVGSKAFWWSVENFFVYNGTVEALPCAIRDLVFKNVNSGQLLKICASVNAQFSEVQWEYPSIDSTENDSYVSFNYVNNTWAYGTLTDGVAVGRTARIDADVFKYPVATDADGNIWLHELTYTAGGDAMPWLAQSGFADLAEGEQFVFVDQVIPDAVQSGGDIEVMVRGQNYPTSTVQEIGPYAAGPDVTFIPTRLRARQIGIEFSNGSGVPGLFWRLGRVRIRAAGDGRSG